MKIMMIASAVACAALFSSTAAVAQVNARIEIGQPGFYGTIDIGDYRPRLYAPQPVIIERHEHYVTEPVYLRVPPGHRKNWRRHCHRYDACDRRVLFVRDDWYQNTYAPRYRSSHGYAEAPVRRVVERRVVEHHVIERRYVDERGRGKHADKHERKQDKHWDKHDKHERKHDKHHDKHHGKH